VHSVGDLKWGLGRGRNGRFEVGRVNDCVAGQNLMAITGQQRNEFAASHIVALREESDSARSKQLVFHDPLVIRADLVPRRTFIHPGVDAQGVDGVGPEWHRVDAVVRRRLVQPYERVGVVPVAAGAVTTINDHHLGIG
jgi:hypothetical protein